MSKVVIDDSKLVNIADAIRNKNGSANKYTPTEMATAIGEIKVSTGAELAPEDLVISGNCYNRFYKDGWNWYVKKFGDKITTKDITDSRNMFSNNSLPSIPFSLNIKENELVDTGYTFYYSKIVSPPYINNLKVFNLSSIFNNCYYLTEVPEDYFDAWDFSEIHKSESGDFSSMFNWCDRLKKIPSDLSMFYNLSKKSYYNFHQAAFYNCNVLGKVTNLPVSPVIYSQNIFYNTFSLCRRLKQITFSLNNGTPKTASWQAQVIDLTREVGYTTMREPLSNYGMPSDTKISNDATYQLLKDNEDSWAEGKAYSRYNHDSAVETINTLPDTSAYLAESGGTTNIIKFEGASGSATDGGAINTLTEAEIAVAAAKGWSVSFV